MQVRNVVDAEQGKACDVKTLEKQISKENFAGMFVKLDLEIAKDFFFRFSPPIAREKSANCVINRNEFSLSRQSQAQVVIW
jgi:hypothetical protein